MSIEARTKPDAQALEDLPVGITLTMTLGEWRRFVKNIDGANYPGWKVMNLLVKSIANVERSLTVLVGETDNGERTI